MLDRPRTGQADVGVECDRAQGFAEGQVLAGRVLRALLRYPARWRSSAGLTRQPHRPQGLPDDFGRSVREVRIVIDSGLVHPNRDDHRTIGVDLPRSKGRATHATSRR